MKLPDITISIKPAHATSDYALIRAQWISSDGTTRRTIQNMILISALENFLGDLVHEMFDEIKTLEEELHG